MKPPESAEILRKNPLGLYVDAIDWSQELDVAALGSAAPAKAPAEPPSIPLGSPLDPDLARQVPIPPEPASQRNAQ